MDELKPCPFCGGNKMDVRTDDNGISWYIFCEDCGLMCGYALTQEDAIEAWNRRVELMEDSISRQAAIKAIEDLQDCYNGFSDTYDKACIIGVLEELPSAVVRCRNCKHWLQIVENPKHGACDQWCTLNVTRAHDYCSRAERKEQE